MKCTVIRNREEQFELLIGKYGNAPTSATVRPP
jgi:hypothetical protein